MFSNKYEEASFKERLAFNTLIKLYNIFSKGYVVNSTPYCGMDEYDFYVHKINENFSIVKRIIIEVKIRSLTGNQLEDARENGFILEVKKYNSLKRMLKIDPEMSLVYVCFTNDGTYFFDLNKLEKDGNLKLVKKEMNAYTMEKERGKVNKGVYLLKPELAIKHFPFVWDDRMFDQEMNRIKIKDEKKIEVVKKDMDIFTKLLLGLNKGSE